jgi:hypothetical protein
MYIIYTAQLGNNLPPACRIIEFADDVCLLSSVALLEAAVRNTEERFNKFDEALQTPSLEISPRKTKFMFSLNKNCPWPLHFGHQENSLSSHSHRSTLRPRAHGPIDCHQCNIQHGLAQPAHRFRSSNHSKHQWMNFARKSGTCFRHWQTNYASLLLRYHIMKKTLLKQNNQTRHILTTTYNGPQ